MNDLDRWFHRQAAREAQIVALEEALLGGRLWRYAWYRLRYFFLTYLVESVAHAVLVLLLFDELAFDNFLIVVFASAGTTLVSQFWWGALEAMRSQVRDLHRAGKPHRIAATIAGWMSLSVIPAAIVGILALVWLAVSAAGPGIGATEVFVAMLIVRTAVDLPTRCYHSGIYALRRVYKPLSATVAPELVGLAVMLGLFPFAGIWALVISQLVVTAMLTGLTVEYTRRVYFFLGLDPLAELGRGAMRDSVRGRMREFFAGGAAHAVMALDSLVVLALLLGARTDSEALVVLFLSMPTVRAGADWARILYFDLKRLELRLFTNLRRRFERHTVALSWLLGVAFWAIASAIATAFYGHGIGNLYLALLAFFLARSLLAREQIQAFADRSYRAVIGTGVACIAGLAAVGPLAEGETERLAAIAAITAACAIVLTRIDSIARAEGEPGSALLTLEWLRRLGEVREPVRVGSARLTSATGPDRLDARSREDRDRWRISNLAEQLARRLRTDGAAAPVGPDRVVWFELLGAEEGAGDERRVTTRWLQRASGGLVARVLNREAPSGEEALLEAGRADLLGPASSHLLGPIIAVDSGAARRTFVESVPGGIVYSPNEEPPEELAAMKGQELRAILFDASSFARDLGSGKRRSSYDVTPLCAGGELELIFIADPHSGRHRRGRWRERVTALNVRASIAGVR